MAILTQSSPSRSIRSFVSQLLSNPMASFYLVVASAGLLIGLGAMMVLSASSVYAYTKLDDAYFFVKRQAAFLVVGLVGALILARTRMERFRFFAWPALFLAILLLMLTYTPLGVEVNGNANWVEFGTSALRVQPSEFAKLAMIIWCAHILATKEKLLDQPRHLLIPLLPAAAVLVLQVVFQGDMGTAVIMLGILAGILWIVGTPLRILVAMAVSAVLGVVAMTLTSANRMRRLSAFLDPGSDMLGANMQATVGVYALATGGWWGVGLGASRQKWGSLPEAHTDYIFAVIGEELGLVGSLFVLALFLVLGFAGFRVAHRSDTLFAKVAAAGITMWFMFQAVVNLGVVLRLVPVMGVPLPMVSYGGSALLANMMALGVLIACSRNEPDAREWLASRRRGPRPRMTTVVGTRRG